MSALRRFAARLVWMVPFAALGITACEHNPAEPGSLASITVARNPETLAISTTVQYTAVGHDGNGRVVGINPAWSVAAGGGTITTQGVFLAGTVPGTYTNTVTATVGSISGTATAIVTAGPVASITVTPTPLTLATNTNQQYTAVGKDAAGNVTTISPSWSVTAGGGTINATTGLFTSGMAPGVYASTVRASVGGISGTASVTVDATALATLTVTPGPVTLAQGSAQTFTATGRDAGGNVISPITIAWSNVTAAAGSITSAGVFTAGTTAGTYANTVTATSGSRTGTATVTVSAGAAASIVVSPTPVTLAIGATQQFTAVVKDAANNTLAITPNWSVAAGGGTINSTGLFTAGTLAGTYPSTATASVGSVSGSATVTVSAGALAIITVTPSPVTLAIGANQTFTAAGKDANGNAVPVTPTWAVVASGGSIVPATGVFTAGTVSGLFANTVRACSTALCAAGSVSGFATVTVNAGALATITVAPNPVGIGTSASQPFTAVGHDANGNIVSITPTWSMLTGAGLAGGTILTPSGVYTAPTLAGSGIDSVRACSTVACGVGSIAGFARVNVSASGALVSIVVTPNPGSVITSGTLQFTATGYDATSLVVPTPGLAWSIVPSQVAAGTIGSGTGLLTAGTVASTYTNAVKATSGTVSGLATVTVTPYSVGPSLGAAGSHGILAGTAVTCAGAPGTINGDASVWPGSSFSGFPPCTITGVQHAADLFGQTAQGDLTTAFLALAAMPCGTTITADLGGTTLAEGVYCAATSVGVTGTVTLTGNANSLFVIRAGSDLTTAGSVVLLGGVLPQNVFWWVGTSATIGTASAWQGNVMALTSVTLVDGATLTGRALARNGAVSLGTGNVITVP